MKSQGFFPALAATLVLALGSAFSNAGEAATPAPNQAASDLSGRLADGRHVLLMRHAYAPGVGDPVGYALDRCDTQRQLDAQGRAQAVRIGRWLAAQGVARARVFSSIWCRCHQTAQLLALGTVEIESSLGSFFDQPGRAADSNRALQNFIAANLRAGPAQPLILVTHHVNIREFMGRDIGSGDMVLVRVDSQGRMLDYRLYPSP
jgi:phosphohistidine phosphatase SixA